MYILREGNFNLVNSSTSTEPNSSMETESASHFVSLDYLPDHRREPLHKTYLVCTSIVTQPRPFTSYPSYLSVLDPRTPHTSRCLYYARNPIPSHGSIIQISTNPRPLHHCPSFILLARLHLSKLQIPFQALKNDRHLDFDLCAHSTGGNVPPQWRIGYGSR